MSLITNYFGSKARGGSSQSRDMPKGAPPSQRRSATVEDDDDNDDFETPRSTETKQKGKKREREASEGTTQLPAVKEPSRKKVKKTTEEPQEEALPWPDLDEDSTSDLSQHYHSRSTLSKAKAKAKASPTATGTSRPILRGKRQGSKSKPEQMGETEKHIRNKEKVKDEEEDIDDIPWDEPVIKLENATTKAEKPPSPVKKATQAAIRSPITKESKRTELVKSSPNKRPATEKTVIEPRTSAKRGGGGGYPYWMQNRAGPPHLGMKELPEGKPWCLWGKVFMCTGVLDSIERDDAFKLIEHYGGKIAKSVTKNLTHAVVGTEAGAKKVDQIESRKDVTRLDEDGLFELIRNSPAHTPSPKEIEKFNQQRKTQGAPIQPKRAPTADLPLSSNPASTSSEQQGSELWVDKYKPKSTREIIANPTAVQKLEEWLKNWNRVELKRAKRGETPAGKSTQKNAALLSGPPGIGKTTTAQLVSIKCGYIPLEFNASDTRSKKMIKEHLAQSTDNRGLTEFFPSGRGTDEGKTILIMDEVDGMSSGDRGGMAEIIALIKKTRIPIICLCNDRASPKVRSLANYCLDIQLQKPGTQEIQVRVAQILQREQITIDSPTLTRIIDASNGDVRQILNMLQMLTVKSKNLAAFSTQELQERLNASLKEIELGPKDAVTKLFNAVEYQKLSLDDKLDLYFIDPSFVPLFIQENYLYCRPRKARNASHNATMEQLVEMDLISKAADSFSESDIFDLAIHRDQDWSLQPIHGLFSTIRPADFMHGHLTRYADFPKWLGKFSSRKKRYRLLTELAVRTSAVTSGDKALLRLDYLPHFIRPLTEPMARKGVDGIDDTLAIMDAYGITRADYDTILELMELSGKDWAKNIPPSVKTAFTRKYKAAHMAVKAAPTRKGALNFVLPEEAAQSHGADEDDHGGSLENESSETGQDDDEKDSGKDEDDDAMITRHESKGTKKRNHATRGSSVRGRGRGRKQKASS